MLHDNISNLQALILTLIFCNFTKLQRKCVPSVRTGLLFVGIFSFSQKKAWNMFLKSARLCIVVNNFFPMHLEVLKLINLSELSSVNLSELSSVYIFFAVSNQLQSSQQRGCVAFLLYLTKDVWKGWSVAHRYAIFLCSPDVQLGNYLLVSNSLFRQGITRNNVRLSKALSVKGFDKAAASCHFVSSQEVAWAEHHPTCEKRGKVTSFDILCFFICMRIFWSNLSPRILASFFFNTQNSTMQWPSSPCPIFGVKRPNNFLVPENKIDNSLG